jgi:hypothetical protein
MKPAPGQPAPGQPAPGQPAPGQPAPGQPHGLPPANPASQPPHQGLYRMVVSFDVEADSEDAAMREAMNVVTDDSMVIEAITKHKETP